VLNFNEFCPLEAHKCCTFCHLLHLLKIF